MSTARALKTSRLVALIACSMLMLPSAMSAPATKTQTTSAPGPSPTVPYASDDPNVELWGLDSDITPEAIRGPFGANIIGPHNIPIALENPSLLAPPTTDHGNVPNAKWPFALSHNRLQTGGWARQQNVKDMPIGTGIAGVDMRLRAGAIRELHWHKTAEWAYVLKGTTQVTTVTDDGQNYVANVNAGDLWYFPAGQPHSLQATDDDPEGTEFLLVFDSGSFDEGSTFLLTDWMAHIPKETVAKNFHTSQSAFDHIPSEELYIFPSTPPPQDGALPSDPQGPPPNPFTYAFSQVNPTQLAGGTIKIADSRSFHVSKTIAVAEVTVEPGAMREIHWHPTADEWTYIIEGTARMTLFAAQSNARTFDYQAGDIAYIPSPYGHYIENTGNSTLRVLEILKTDVFQDVSLNQWLALTPAHLVKAHLDLSDDTITHLSKVKPIVTAPQS